MKYEFIFSMISISLVLIAQKSNGKEIVPDDNGSSQEERVDTHTIHQIAHENQSSDQIAQRIRHELTMDTSLSSAAKNIKIVTNSNSVTLRGMVQTQDEKDKLEAIAEKVATNRTVENELEVKKH